MAARIIRAVPRSLYNLSGVPAGGEVYFHIARDVDVREFTEITAYVRVHAGSSVGYDPTAFVIDYFAYGPCDDDPASLTTASPPLFGSEVLVASTDLSVGLKGTSGGLMQATALPSNVGSFMNIYLVLVPSVTSTFQVILSVDLICKNRDPGPDHVFEADEREPLLTEVMD